MAAGTEEGHGQAGRGRERRKAEGGGLGREGGGMGVAAQLLLPERSLSLAAGSGQQGPRGLSRPSHASPRLPADSSPRPPPQS